MAAVRAELLERTDGRIHDESELRDELARHVAELEDQVQADNEEEEDEDVSITLNPLARMPPTKTASKGYKAQSGTAVLEGCQLSVASQALPRHGSNGHFC